MKKSRNTDNLIPIGTFAAILAVWELFCRLGGVPGYILPAPSRIAAAFFGQIGVIFPHIGATLYESLMGFLLSAAVGVLFAVAMDLSPAVKKALYPLIVVSQTIPTIAIAPLFVIWFGFGTLPKIAIVALVCFFPVALNLCDGFASIDPDAADLFTLMGAGKAQTFFLLKIPAAATSFFSGLKIAATYSVMGAVIGEWLGGEKGLGVYMMRVKNAFALDKMFAVVAVIVAMSMAIFGILSIIESLSMPWKRAQRKDKGEYY